MSDGDADLQWAPTGELRWLTFHTYRLLQQKWLGYPYRERADVLSSIPYCQPREQWRIIPSADAAGMGVDEMGVIKLKDLPND